MYKVVTVDDEPMIKRSLQTLINRTGIFEVAGEAEDGREALNLMDKLVPDIVITDIRMPVMDGLEMIEEMRNRGMKSEIVIISGYEDFSYAQKAIRFGIVDYLLKPVKPASLLESLERLRARLEIRRQEMAQRSEWIAACRKTADEIAEQVWLLEAEEVEAAVRQFHRMLLDNRSDPHMMRNAYAELLSFLRASMSDKGISGFCPAVPWNVYDSPLPHQCMDDVLTLLKDTMERIRKSRNWGIHQSIQRAVDYMKFRFADETLSLQEVAGQVHMSPAYFSRSFKQEMGQSFIQYLTRLRMEKAKQLLEDPNRKTYDIAGEVGYTDYPHFAKVFKKYCGMTPTEYRKRLGVL